MRTLSRKMVPLALAGLTSLATPTSVVAQAAEFPNKPVTLIVPFQAGISVDILLRGIAEVAGQHLGQPVVIDNKAGGSATLGPAHMASNAKPDGYTIAQIPMPVLRVLGITRQVFSWIGVSPKSPLTVFLFCLPLRDGDGAPFRSAVLGRGLGRQRSAHRGARRTNWRLRRCACCLRRGYQTSARQNHHSQAEGARAG